MRKKYLRKKLIVLSALVFLLLLIAALAPFLTPYDPYGQDLSNALKAPSWEHLLGTDRYGRDMFSRVLMGGRTSIYSALVLVGAVALIGTAAGIFCGLWGGWIDAFIMRVSDMFLAFPGMVFAIAAAGALGGGISNAVLALACISWPKFARIARSQVLTIKSRPYIEAARLSGCTSFQIVRRHILPNMAGTILITAALDIGTMMMELAGLSFLGLGAQPPAAEWGSMMSNGRSMLQTAPWVILAPGFGIFLTVMAFNLLGDGIRDYIDPSQNHKKAGRKRKLGRIKEKFKN